MKINIQLFLRIYFASASGPPHPCVSAHARTSCKHIINFAILIELADGGCGSEVGWVATIFPNEMSSSRNICVSWIIPVCSCLLSLSPFNSRENLKFSMLSHSSSGMNTQTNNNNKKRNAKQIEKENNAKYAAEEQKAGGRGRIVWRGDVRQMTTTF